LKGYHLRLLPLIAPFLAGCIPIVSQDPPAAVPSLTAIQALASPSVVPQSLAAPATEQRSPSPSASIPTTDTPTNEPAVTSTAPTSVQAFPDPGEYTWELVVDGLERPVDLVEANDGSGRLFVLEQAGVVRVIQNEALLPQPYLDIRPIVGSQGNEQGLLGVVFHPRFAENGYLYLNYTDRNGNTNIARYTRSPENQDLADPQSEKRLLFVEQPYPNHNGGSLAFGPDGYLYLGLGDGGSAGDPQGYAQRRDTYLGKILRIDVDGGDPYAIPADNPFADGGSEAGGGLPEIWAYGLRNPWRFSFDRLNGDMYIADVGQGEWEEIDFLPAGSLPGVNFGWDYREGRHPYEGAPPRDASLVDPVEEYNHSQGCSVTGGYVYRGEALPEWGGIYLYGDFCSGFVWGALRGLDGAWESARLFETGINISSFGEDLEGEIYLLDLNGGIYRLARRR
jgi:glucose/arabinose dehydrogenase